MCKKGCQIFAGSCPNPILIKNIAFDEVENFEDQDGHENMHFFLINGGREGVQKKLIL